MIPRMDNPEIRQRMAEVNAEWEKALRASKEAAKRAQESADLVAEILRKYSEPKARG